MKLTRLFLYLIGFCAVVYAVHLFSPEVEINDSREYVQLSENLSNSGLHYAGSVEEELDFRLFSKRPLFYPSFLSIGGFNSRLFIPLIQIVFVLLLFIIGLQIIKLSGEYNRSLYIIYSLFYLCSIPLIVSSQFLMADLLLSVLMALMVYYFILHLQSSTYSELKTVAILWTIALLCKPIIFPSIAIAVVYFTILAFRKKYCWSLLLPLSVALIVCSYNYKLSGSFHYSSISSINRLHYNSKLLSVSTLDPYELLDSDDFNLAPPRTKDEFSTYLREAKNRSNANISDHKLDYIKLHFAGMLKSLIDPGRFELYTFAGQNTKDISLTEYLYSGRIKQLIVELQKAGALLYLFAFLLIISGIKLICAGASLIKRQSYFWLLALVVLYFIGIAGPIGAFRFLLPAIIPYTLLASFGFYNLLEFFQKGSVS